MRRLCLVVATFATFAAVFDAVSGARAEIDYPFCIGGEADDKAVQCEFTTLEQCQASASGTGGSCFPNRDASAKSNETAISPAPARHHRRAKREARY
jgi:hypothetical protein